MFTFKRNSLDGLMFAADGAAGGGLPNPGEAVGGLIPKPATPDPAAQTGASPASTPTTAPDGAQSKTAIDALPEDIQAYIRELRRENETHRKASKSATEAAAAAENARLAEQGKYKELYEKTAADFAAAKANDDRTKELETAFNATLEARIAAVPKEFQNLIPRALSPVQLSAWLDSNAAALTTRMAPKLDAGAASVSGQPYAGSVDHLKKVATRYNIAYKGKLTE